jgi:hypothetical protein
VTDLHIPRHWRYRLLGVLDAPANEENLRFLAAWAQAEGGTAQYNTLNTTYSMPGSWDYNSVHVKNYATTLEGICAMALTIGLTKYVSILSTLRLGTNTAEQIVGICRPALVLWGSNPDLILDVLKTM